MPRLRDGQRIPVEQPFPTDYAQSCTIHAQVKFARAVQKKGRMDVRFGKSERETEVIAVGGEILLSF